ncbi:MAG: type II toxin-antitoxin system RelE/ParE family toxin [Candidatus Azobacteroides sp.]|nr:type II toxin-antitoxin system RelE/ParE family toxin [Candidatus Azobacteroides sp.]
MKKYRVVIENEAMTDLYKYVHFIHSEYKMPITAAKHLAGLRKEIKKLAINAEIFAICTNESLQKYGSNVRRVEFKRMAIIYTVSQSTVSVKRIIPASMIID